MDKEQVKKYATEGVKVGKQILLYGTSAIVTKALTVGVNKLFTEGVSGLKQTSFDEFIGVKKKLPEQQVIVVGKVEEA